MSLPRKLALIGLGIGLGAGLTKSAYALLITSAVRKLFGSTKNHTWTNIRMILINVIIGCTIGYISGYATGASICLIKNTIKKLI